MFYSIFNTSGELSGFTTFYLFLYLERVRVPACAVAHEQRAENSLGEGTSKQFSLCTLWAVEMELSLVIQLSSKVPSHAELPLPAPPAF